MQSSPEIEFSAVLKDALQFAHKLLEQTLAGVDDELANRRPAGRANAIGACFLHVLLSEDRLVNRPKIRAAEPLLASTFRDRTGADKLDSAWGQGDLGEWYRTVNVDMERAAEYGRAVFAMSEDWVGSLSAAELARQIDSGPLGQIPLANWIEIFLTGHANALAGEISAVKGTFGLKGYPF